jgi:hypothetical protein
MTRPLSRLVLVVVTGAVLAGGANLSQGWAVRVEDRERGFLLAISTPQLEWSAEQAISVSADLSYLGPGSITVSGPGPGSHVAFEVVELTGTRKMEPLWLLACVTWKMTAVPLAIPFRKSGGYSPDEPDAAFYEAYFAEAEFRLPAGRWRVSALGPFSVGDCSGPNVNLRAGFTLTVK